MTPEELLAAVPYCGAGRAAAYAQPITSACDEFEISTLQRKAAFLAQIAHESGSFAYTHEIWGPTPAQAGYEGRADLGNTQAGDGTRFKGRGLLQITGRANYLRCGQALGVDLIQHPELLETPSMAARSAGWFWHTHGLNKHADVDAFGTITKIINGGFNGIDSRCAAWRAACKGLKI